MTIDPVGASTLSRQLALLLILPIPIASIAWTITHEDLFREPRDWCIAKSKSCRCLCLLSVMDHCLRSRHYDNVADLMKLQPESEHPHGLSDREFDELFTTDKPVIFAFHG